MRYSCMFLILYTARAWRSLLLPTKLHRRQQVSLKSQNAPHLLQESSLAIVNPMSWRSLASSNIEFAPALDEIIEKLDDHSQESSLAVFFVSSSYESMKDQQDFDLGTVIREKFPKIGKIIGCTTSCPIGLLDGKPSEIESRQGISLLLVPKEAGLDIEISMMQLKDITGSASSNDNQVAAPLDRGIGIIFATDNEKSRMSRYIRSLESQEQVEVFGAVASAVTSLHSNKVFYSPSPTEPIEKVFAGAVAAVIKGDISAHSYLCPSVRGVGEVYDITDSEVNTILGVREESEEKSYSPLEALDILFNATNSLLTPDDSMALKRDLTVLVWAEGKVKYGQKPIAMDPIMGSITLPALGASSSPRKMQFAVRDMLLSRGAVESLSRTLQGNMQYLAQEKVPLHAVLTMGGIERGVKLFRVKNFETERIVEGMEGIVQVDVGGLHGNAAVCSASMIVGSAEGLNGAGCLMTDTDNIVTIITPRLSPLIRQHLHTLTQSTPFNYEDSTISSNFPALSPFLSPYDQLNAQEKVKYNDELLEGLIVQKRDPEAAHAVKVGTMDFFVPDKTPLPSNFLESLVWERDKDLDRLRERYATNRALVMAKQMDKKFPPRSLSQSVQELKKKMSLLSGHLPLVFIELTRSSVNNGMYPVDITNIDASNALLLQLGNEVGAIGLPIASIGCNVDTSIYKGSYEDIELLRTSSPSASALTLFCQDFVVYAYQLFRARAAGTDWIKLHAAVLSTQEMSYMAKTSKALGMGTVVVVSSVAQAVEVLTNVQAVDGMCVTSRNMLLWKIDSGKAERILAHPEVQKALKERKEKQTEFLLLQEGFSRPGEIGQAGFNGVDAVILGEELVYDQKDGIVKAIEKWYK